MAENGRVVSISELRDILVKEEENGANMIYEKRMALEHAQMFAHISKEDADRMMKDLMEIDRITEAIACKFTEIMPTHPDDVRAVLAKERFEIDEDAINRIIDITSKYLSKSD